MKRTLTLLVGIGLVLLAASASAQLRITDTSHYVTETQMLLANEINESGEPYAEALGYDLDVLDPMQPGFPDATAYTLGIENYEYSRYQLGVVIARSGIGLHMMWSPVIRAQAAMETDPGFDGSFTGPPNGYREDDELMKVVMHFGQLADHVPPTNAWPQFGEFVEGDPHYAQPVDADAFTHDFATLRWDRSRMIKELSPGAMGQTLMKQYLWSQDMLSAFHDTNGEAVEADGSVSPDGPDGVFDPDNGIFYGGDDLDGFVGQVLTAEAVNKVKNLVDNLAFDGRNLGSIDLMTYDPVAGLRYFPHRIAVDEEPVPGLPPQAADYDVVDPRSDLFDQASLLWGAVHFADMMNPNNSSDAAHLAYHAAFDGDPFPAAMSETGVPGPFDLMKGTAKAVFLNLMAMHFDATAGSFVDFSRPVGFGRSDDGGDDHDDDGIVRHGVQLGSRLSTVDAAYLLVALDSFLGQFSNTPLAAAARDAIAAQADFLIASVDHRNLYREWVRVGGHDRGQRGAPSLLAQAAAVRALYSAYDALGDARYRDAADSAYTTMVETYFRGDAGLFATGFGGRKATYDPQIMAILSGALREARLVGDHEDATDIYVSLWNNVANTMQLAEGANTGETGGDSDGDGIPFIPEQAEDLAPVFAPRAEVWLGSLGGGHDGVSPAGASGTGTVPMLATPNPFNPVTVIAFDLPQSAHVTLAIYDVLGRAVRHLIEGDLPSGVHEVTFLGDDLSSGVYYYVLDTGGNRQVGKMTLVK